MGAGVATNCSINNNKLYCTGWHFLFYCIPGCLYIYEQLLKIFSYNTGLTVAPFLLSALAVLVITMVTVSFHAVMAAMATPVKSLRTE
jgi:putative ABC transport system permease protein